MSANVETGAEQVYTAQPVRPKRSRRGWGLDSLPAVRRRLARVITDMDRDLIPLDKGRALIYGLSTVAGILKDEKTLSIEERLCRLEEAEGIHDPYGQS